LLCSDVHNLRTESLKQQYEVVKDRTSAHGTYSLGSHVMPYGDQRLGAQSLAQFIGTNPANDNATFGRDNSLRRFSGAVNQRDADLIYFWQKVLCDRSDGCSSLSFCMIALNSS